MPSTESPTAVPELIPRGSEPQPQPLPQSTTPKQPEKRPRPLRSTTHKRHKSWDASGSTPVLEPPAQPYPRSRSSSPRHGIIEVEEEEEEEGPREKRRSRGTLITASAGEWLGDMIGIRPEDWPYSQELLSATVSLKVEQARAKNLSLKLSTVQASMDLLKLAVEANIPPQLIPSMLASGELSNQQMESAVKEMKGPKSPQKAQNTSVFKVNIPQQTQFQFHHWQKPGEPKGDFKDERKRKSSDDQPQSTANTPTRPQQGASHRRNQSEANVSHLRSLYETQPQPRPQPPQQPQPQHRAQRLQSVRSLAPSYPQQYYQQPPQQQPWASPTTLGSPYHQPREQQPQFAGRPVYYQYPAQPPPGHQPPPKLPIGYPQPLPGFQFPRREMPPPGTQPPQGQTSGTNSPVSAKKGDVSFLISTPNNPPK